MVIETIKRIKQKFDKDKIIGIIKNADEELVKSGNIEILPDERKALIIKLVTLRYQKLLTLLK